MPTEYWIMAKWKSELLCIHQFQRKGAVTHCFKTRISPHKYFVMGIKDHKPLPLLTIRGDRWLEGERFAV